MESKLTRHAKVMRIADATFEVFTLHPLTDDLAARVALSYWMEQKPPRKAQYKVCWLFDADRAASLPPRPQISG